ncbi:hypothetical protein D915_010990 [Fasciola hepatica]|uniref:Uncharacterized protein n=1 Tax=Fasciola hepatica TaxID=6192 RepID=A0A4E0R8E5_FASHE|nr:hypothetical protein D915_010990 [Fasciola hepatica]
MPQGIQRNSWRAHLGAFYDRDLWSENEGGFPPQHAEVSAVSTTPGSQTRGLQRSFETVTKGSNCSRTTRCFQAATKPHSASLIPGAAAPPPLLPKIQIASPALWTQPCLAVHRLIAANGTVKPIMGQVAGSVIIGRFTVQHQFLCADLALGAILGIDFLRTHRMVIDFDKQRLAVARRPGPIGQPIAALKVDNSWINEVSLGECVDRETNSEVAMILNKTRGIFECNCNFSSRTHILQH